MPNPSRRLERAKRAKDTINRAIPEVLRSVPRARHGIHQAELMVDPVPYAAIALQNSDSTPPLTPDHPKIRVTSANCIAAAARVSERPRTTASVMKKSQKPNVAVLNMASPMRPGGGFLDGANSQEEFLCARSTLYPSLWESFYRLPELGGVYTPDVMVFRDDMPEANDLEKRDRFFVDVITSGMFRFPDVSGKTERRSEGCSCGVSYCDQDRELVTRKMKAVLRMAQAKGAERVVLGAWGCGAYGNPVKEVAKIWRKVIAGSPRQRRPNTEQWEGIKEIIFAIPDRTMIRDFERAFEGVLAPAGNVSPSEPVETNTDAGAHAAALDADINNLFTQIAEIELQMEQMPTQRSKARLKDVLAGLRKQLSQGISAKAAQDEDLTKSRDETSAKDEDDEEVDDFIVSGFPASDGEENSFYNFDENDVPSDSSTDDCYGGEPSINYEFKVPAPPGLDHLSSPPQKSRSLPHHRGDSDSDSDNDNDQDFYAVLHPSPQFNPSTGWFNGSIDHLTAMLRGSSRSKGPPTQGRGSGQGSASRGKASPVLTEDGDEIVAGEVLDERTLNAYLSRYEGSDALE
ncbi:hypothetical protein MBLNU230_g0072t1 [Neophaeotheca triangularis]